MMQVLSAIFPCGPAYAVLGKPRECSRVGSDWGPADRDDRRLSEVPRGGGQPELKKSSRVVLLVARAPPAGDQPENWRAPTRALVGRSIF